jgi:hypothetical protein
MIFAPEPDPNAVSAYCESMLTDGRQRCSDTVSDVDGEKYTWTVTKPGEYELSVFAPKKKVSLIPQLVIKNAAGEELSNESGPMGGTVTSKIDVAAGTYEVTVLPADNYMVKGGFSFDLEIKSLTVVPVAAPVAAADSAKADEEAAPAAAGPYTEAQLTERIASLNEICGDTYCEGSFEYEFKKLTCLDEKHCVLAFTATHHEKKKPMDVELPIGNFKSLTISDTEEYVYEGSFDEAVGNALMKWEENPVAKKAFVAAPAKSKSIAKPAAEPKPTKVKAVAAAPKPVVAAKKSPAAATTVNRTSKNLAD